jgi:hypothetical protein
MKWFQPWGVECHNMALGDGTPLRFNQSRSGSGYNYFSHSKDRQYEYGSYTVPSKTLSSIMEDFKVQPPYILKIDCEGGERFMLTDPGSKDIVRNSLQVVMELHRSGGPFETWMEFFKSIDTHDTFILTKEDDPDLPGHKHYVYNRCPPDQIQPRQYLNVQLLRKELTDGVGPRSRPLVPPVGWKPKDWYSHRT